MENEITVGDSVDVINAKLKQSAYTGSSDAELEQMLTSLGVSLSLFAVIDGQLVRRS